MMCYNEVIWLKTALFVLANGGDVTKKHCYDEEGVECWIWEFQGKEWTETGLHDEVPVIPDQMVEYVYLKYKHRITPPPIGEIKFDV